MCLVLDNQDERHQSCFRSGNPEHFITRKHLIQSEFAFRIPDGLCLLDSCPPGCDLPVQYPAHAATQQLLLGFFTNGKAPDEPINNFELVFFATERESSP